MKKILLLIAILSISACASIEETRIKRPSENFSTTKDVREISECVLFAWQKNTRYGNVVIQPLHGGGYTVISQGVNEFVDLTPNDKGSVLKFFYDSSLFGYRIDSRREGVKSCI